MPRDFAPRCLWFACFLIARLAFADDAVEIADDVQDVPAIDVRIGDDEQRRCYFIGPMAAKSTRPAGRRLLVVLPGGDGGADFTSFIRRIHQNCLNDEWIVAQMVAPKWSPTQQIVWPTERSRVDAARFTTEAFFDAVVDDAVKRGPVDRNSVYILAWSSGGPAAYAITLRETSNVAGAFIAMSVFRAARLKTPAGPRRPAFHLLQSPDDHVTRIEQARAARDWLKANELAVQLVEYPGGHSWNNDPFGRLRTGFGWLVNQRETR